MTAHFTRKYLEAFVFSDFWPTEDSSQFLYMYEVQGKKHLYRFDSQRHKCLEEGERLIDIDFNKQAFWPVKITKNTLYLVSDTDNQENYNLFAINLSNGEIKQITQNEYTACVRVTDDELAYYSSRTINEKGRFQNEIHLHNLKTGEVEVVTSDKDDEYRVGWGKVTPSRNGKFLLLQVDKNSERTNENFCLVDLERKNKKILISRELESGRFYLIDDVVDTDAGFYFVSDVSGFDNLYYYDFADSSSKKLTDVNDITEGFSSLLSEGERYFYHTQFIPEKGQTKVFLLKEEGIGSVSSLKDVLSFDGEAFVIAQKKDFLWVIRSNLTQTPERILYKLQNSRLEKVFSIPFVKKTNEDLVHSTHEFIAFTSFDGLKIPSYLVIPKGEIKGAVITAFYGGGNFFRAFYQIIAELGFVSLSPAVRGSWGYGKEWENKLKGDLGGNEILDLLWGAKFLEEKFDLTPSQIGVEGGSHGGYSTLRALTLPENFKGQESQYPFGFGICWAGFADLVDFYEKSNIPDWLVNLLGPYEENKELYKDRSPLTHFKELKTPLFITHGTKDSRVPPSTMDAFLRKLEQSRVPHYIYLMEGQGHTGGSIEERIDEYVKIFEFLNNSTSLNWCKEGL